MDIKHIKDENRLAMYDGEKEIGEITYSPSKGLWVVDHTGMSSEYEGRGLAAELVKAVVEAARKENVQIMPLCPYAKHQFEKHEEYKDVWKK